EKPGSEMPDSAANLPGHQWILVGGIIPNHQHGFRLIQLLHGEKGIGGTFAKRRDESCVISGAVMVDVVGAKGRAGEMLQKIILFVRSAIRADEADRVLAARVVRGLQLSCGGFGGLFPRNGEKLVTLAQQRLT